MTQVEHWRALYDDGSYPSDFWDWLRDNEHLFRAFINIALQAKNQRGIKRWSARGISEVLRWETALREGGQGFIKINDHSTPGLARLAMKLVPELNGFFATRESPAAQHGRRLIDAQPYHRPVKRDPPDQGSLDL